MKSTSLPWMESVDAKIRRAKEHLWTLNRDLTELGRSYKPTVFLKNDQRSVWLVVVNESPYADLSHSAVFGDFLHNLRSALDAMVYGMIRRAGGTPSGKSAFPAWTSQEYFDNHTKMGRDSDVLAGVPVPARKLIRDLQPFQRGPRNMDLDPLFQLNTMQNEDKHQTSHIMLGYAKHAHFRAHTLCGPVDFASDGPLIGHGPWQIGVPVSSKDVPTPEMRIEATGAVDFLIRTDHAWQGRPILDFANNCLRYVEDEIIPKFRPFFK